MENADELTCEILNSVSPHETTPALEGFKLVCTLARLYNERVRDPKPEFMDTHFAFMLDNRVTGDAQFEELRTVWTEDAQAGRPITAEKKQSVVWMNILLTALAYSTQAIQAEQTGPFGWVCLTDANYYFGLIEGQMLNDGGKAALSRQGRLGADAAHAEDRAMKKVVMDWCDENMKNFKSMDAAAEAIAGRIVPVKFRTARAWVGAWKKLGSAGTA